MAGEKIREICGFPNYKFDLENDVVYRQMKDGMLREVKKRMQPYRSEKSFIIGLRKGGKSCTLSFYRLKYAVEHGISYYSMPRDVKVFVDTDGRYKLLTASEHIDVRNEKVRQENEAMRLQRIDERIKELEMLRRYYVGGDMSEMALYIEGRKDLLVGTFMKRYGRSLSFSVYVYSLAFEKFFEMIEKRGSLTTNITVGMMGYMNKVRMKMASETFTNEII